MKKVIEVIADDPNVVADNDFGTVLPGDQFVAKIRAERGWDWADPEQAASFLTRT